MRIIAGEKRGLRLEAPDDNSIRPTSDKVREAVFGSIQFGIADKLFLDLFSGSGAVGIEALSRGASFVYFSESSRRSAALIEKNIKKIGYEDRCRILLNDYRANLLFLSGKKVFDYVYADPPYADAQYSEILSELAKTGTVDDRSVVILESDHELDIDNDSCFEIFKKKKYGKTHISFVRYKCNE